MVAADQLRPGLHRLARDQVAAGVHPPAEPVRRLEHRHLRRRPAGWRPSVRTGLPRPPPPAPRPAGRRDFPASIGLAGRRAASRGHGRPPRRPRRRPPRRTALRAASAAGLSSPAPTRCGSCSGSGSQPASSARRVSAIGSARPAGTSAPPRPRPPAPPCWSRTSGRSGVPRAAARGGPRTSTAPGPPGRACGGRPGSGPSWRSGPAGSAGRPSTAPTVSVRYPLAMVPVVVRGSVCAAANGLAGAAAGVPLDPQVHPPVHHVVAVQGDLPAQRRRTAPSPRCTGCRRCSDRVRW